ncbi:MAG: hypothetical protein AAF664_17565 [Planctomycetota bacterium]
MTSVKSMISRGALAPGYGLEPDAIALRLIKTTGRKQVWLQVDRDCAGLPGLVAQLCVQPSVDTVCPETLYSTARQKTNSNG